MVTWSSFCESAKVQLLKGIVAGSVTSIYSVLIRTSENHPLDTFNLNLDALMTEQCLCHVRGMLLMGIHIRTQLGTPASDPTKLRFPGVSLSVSEPTQTRRKLFSLPFLKKQQWEKLNNGLWCLPMYSITAAASPR